MTKQVLSIIDDSGDTRVSWTPGDAKSMKAAELVFDALRARGHALYRIGADGKSDTVTHSFDPNARMVAVPALQGG